jgi:hypothetical protein
MKVGIKYCGGCNPRFDRLNIAKQLQSELADLTIKPAGENEVFDVIAVICGCFSQCAKHDTLKGKYGKVIITKSADYEKLRNLILKNCKQENQQEGMN